MSAYGVRFETRADVDFVIIGSGASGGVLAKELSIAGFDVVVLEQGPYRKAPDFKHDEWAEFFRGEMTSHPVWNDPQTFRANASDRAVSSGAVVPAWYARTVGGSSVHFSANYWRFRPVDFSERSLLGSIANTGFSDWPISYEELEPYYTKVEWQLGVCGAPGPFDPPRSRPYPLPPMPVKSSGVLMQSGALKCGMHPQVAPLAILSQPFNGRPACIHCGFCLGFGCEMNAKSSTLAAMLPLAEASGHCEIRPLCTVFRIGTHRRGRISEVIYRDAQGTEQGQKTRAVIVAANGAETPRLLLLSESSQYPDGLANGSGLVGKYLMGNAHSALHAVFEQPLNDFKGVQCSRMVLDFYDADPQRGFYGGGGLDARSYLGATPALNALNSVPPGVPAWGSGFKRFVARSFARRMTILGSATSLPLERNNVSLDPEITDAMGRPALRVTYRDHDDDLAMAGFLQDRAEEIALAAGAIETWREPIEHATVLAHLLGTCRMGDDPADSVVDRYHRSHEVPNLFVCDGSSLVTSGRGQPTMTIQALAFRAAEHIAAFARRGEI